MLYAVHQYDRRLIINLVHDPIIAPAGGPQSREFTHEGLAYPVWSRLEATEHQLDRRRTDLLRETVEVTQALRSDLDLVHEDPPLHLVAKTQTLSLGSLLLRTTHRCDQGTVTQDVHRLLQ